MTKITGLELLMHICWALIASYTVSMVSIQLHERKLIDIGMVTSSMILNVNPWIHKDNYHEVVSFVRDQVEKSNSTPTITSITKLGI